MSRRASYSRKGPNSPLGEIFGGLRGLNRSAPRIDRGVNRLLKGVARGNGRQAQSGFSATQRALRGAGSQGRRVVTGALALVAIVGTTIFGLAFALNPTRETASKWMEWEIRQAVPDPTAAAWEFAAVVGLCLTSYVIWKHRKSRGNQ